jgi:CDP-diacylglycerol--glycerol-3-phosphate 3-phosphatidyltransferase
MPASAAAGRGAAGLSARRNSRYNANELQMPELRMNLPNSLTLVRIFLVPLLVVVLLTKPEGRLVPGLSNHVLGAGIFAVAAFTDWLDGYVARRRKQITVVGQLLDPVADKLLTAAAFISLVQMGAASAWIVAIIVGRELAVTVLRSLAYTKGVVIPSSPLGKGKMSSQVAAILLLILGHDGWPWLSFLGHIALWVVMLTAVLSAADYYRRYSLALSGMSRSS